MILAPVIRRQIQRSEQMKVNPADARLVIGNRDMEASALSVRVHGKGNLGSKPRDEILADILQSTKDRRA